MAVLLFYQYYLTYVLFLRPTAGGSAAWPDVLDLATIIYWFSEENNYEDSKPKAKSAYPVVGPKLFMQITNY
jgi:hypothetical protein